MAGDAANVDLIILDTDGVLTDGGIYLDDRGVETKRFHVRDGFAMRMWMRFGGQLAIITGRCGGALMHRANELGVEHVIQGSANKLEDFTRLLNELELPASSAAVIGDDFPDLPMMGMAGYPIAVADAVKEVREAACFTTVRPGGHGAVREAIEHLLKAQGRWDDVLDLYR